MTNPIKGVRTGARHMAKREGLSRAISAKAWKAVELMASGNVQRHEDLAILCGLSKSAISRTFNRPDVRQYLVARARSDFALLAPRARMKVSDLLEQSDNKSVQLDSARFALGVVGVKPPSAPVASAIVNNVSVAAGYILRTDADAEALRRQQADAAARGQLPPATGYIIDLRANRPAAEARQQEPEGQVAGPGLRIFTRRRPAPAELEALPVDESENEHNQP